VVRLRGCVLVSPAEAQNRHAPSSTARNRMQCDDRGEQDGEGAVVHGRSVSACWRFGETDSYSIPATSAERSRFPLKRPPAVSSNRVKAVDIKETDRMTEFLLNTPHGSIGPPLRICTFETVLIGELEGPRPMDAGLFLTEPAAMVMFSWP